MKKITIVSLCTALLALVAGSAVADEVVIKLGTSAPQGSPWHTGLKEVANRWREISGGRVVLRIFAGGTMGDEGDMVKKMRIGQLQAAGLSTVGLHDIAPEPQALDSPLVVRNYPERDYLLQKMAPELEDALAKKGFVVLTWSEIGFTYFFSTTSRPTLDEMRKAKVFCWNGDPASKDAWIAGGFKPVILSAVDMIPSLQTGMIDTVLYPATVAFGIQAYDKAKFMMDMPYSTLTGAIIVTKEAWDRVPAELRAPLKAKIVELGNKGTIDARQFEQDAIAKMKQKGLTVVPVTDVAAWQKAVDSVRSAIRGKVVPAQTFDNVLNYVKEYRAAHK